MYTRLVCTLPGSALLLSAAATWAAPAAHPVAATPAVSSSGSLLQVIFGLIVVLGLMALLAWALRRFNAGKALGPSNIRVVGGVNVGPRERVMVVEIADQWVVVGVAPGRVNALATMQKQEAALAEDAAPAGNFSSWLTQTMDKRNKQTEPGSAGSHHG